MIKQLIGTLVAGSSGLPYDFGDKGWQNLQADEQASEFVWLLDPVQFNFVDTTFMQESYPVVIMFLKKTKLDATPQQLDAATDAMRMHVRSFVNYAVSQKQLVKAITDLRSIEIHHALDADYSGWMLYATIQPYATESTCY